MTEPFDCVVVGSGPGGYVAALRAADLGMRTAIVERRGLAGGRCLHEACVPAKAVLRSADAVDEVRAAAGLGVIVGDAIVDFARVAGRRDEIVAGLARGISGLLAGRGVEMVEGTALLRAVGGSAVSVQVDDRVLAPSSALILATGSKPSPLPGIPFGHGVVSTRDAWALVSLPAALVIVGAGASGVELASAYARLGTEVTLVEGADRVLPTEEPDASRAVDARLRADGVDVRVGALVESAAEAKGRVEVVVEGATVLADRLVVASGRRADLSVLGEGAAALQLDDRGLVAVDGRGRTSLTGVYAIGDLVAGPALAHKASAEAVVAVEDAFGLPTVPVDHRAVPRVTFCAPNVGSVGLTEADARAAGRDVAVGRSTYGAVGAGVLYATEGWVKLIADRPSGEILGAHVMGSRAAEILQQIVDVRGAEGGLPELARTVHSHPTLSEAVAEAARAAEGWAQHATSAASRQRSAT